MKIGLEVHQQLATGKLFCSCTGDLSETTKGQFVRMLQATGGETGTTDRAAKAQSSKKTQFRYQVTPNTCLVEADEEPPHTLNMEALNVALTMAELVGARVPDEAIVMRKIVVDGSNTAGFQRTVIIAMDGSITVSGKTHGISSICLEEDAARKIADSAGEITYRLDRMGIPLIEIATEPDIESGKEAREVAEAIGMLLRATRKVKRGLGTVREDLNVSIPEGARVEIKGVQELSMIAEYVEREAQRQSVLLERVRELKNRNPALTPVTPADVTHLFHKNVSKIIAPALHGGGGAVLALPLPGYAGLLGSKEKDDERIGRELADRAKTTGVQGLLHSDELPAYGITAEEVELVRKELSIVNPQDGFMLVASPSREKAYQALMTAREGAIGYLAGVPEETRDPLPDGKTKYSRPLPGRHRMYPETDLPPCKMEIELIGRIRENLPERPEATILRFVEMGLSTEVSLALLRSGDAIAFDALVMKGHSPTVVARVLTQELPAIEKDAKNPLFEGPEAIPKALEPALDALKSEKFSKEGLEPVLRRMLLAGEDVETATEKAGVSQMTAADLEIMVKGVLDQNAAMITERKAGALSPLMGDVMAKVRGRRDGKEVSDTVNRLLMQRIEGK